MRSADKKKMQDLIRQECCNYFGGFCPIRDKDCIQIKADKVVCKWFKEAVAPLDPSITFASDTP